MPIAAAAIASVAVLTLGSALRAQDAAATTTPPTAAASAVPAELTTQVEDFWHFAKIARYDAANAKAQAIAAMGAEPVHVLAAFETVATRRGPGGGGAGGDDLSQYMVRFEAVPELSESATAIQKILIDGR